MTTRRSILKWLAVTPLAVWIGACRKPKDSVDQGTAKKPPALGEQLVHLFCVVGPWTNDDRDKAVEFYTGVVTPELVAEYEPKSATVALLWKRFAESPFGVDEIDLGDGDERVLLEKIVDAAYAPKRFINETRFVAANVPLLGQCQGAQWPLGPS